MPRQAFFSKDEILSKALQIIREKGSTALSARSLSAALGCSLSPIFTIFKNMDEINAEVRIAAQKLFADYVADVMDYSPAFKEFGLRLIRFGNTEQNIFHYLFIESDTYTKEVQPKLKECLAEIEKDYNLTPEESALILRQIWPFACGLAVLCWQQPEAYTENLVSEMMSFQFSSIMFLIKSKHPITNITPHLKINNENELLKL